MPCTVKVVLTGSGQMNAELRREDVMKRLRMLIVGFQVALAALLVVSYGSAVAGLIGWLDARTVSFLTIFGGLVALVAAVGYFLSSERELKQRFRSTP